MKSYKEFINESNVPNENQIINFVVGKKPKDKKEMYKLIHDYFINNKLKYDDFDEYQSAMDFISNTISKKLNISLDDTMTIDEFKETHNTEPKVGYTWKVDVASPGIGSYKYKVTKIENDIVHYSVDSSRIRELTIGDVY